MVDAFRGAERYSEPARSATRAVPAALGLSDTLASPGRCASESGLLRAPALENSGDAHPDTRSSSTAVSQ
jgi:hypothetical protein